MNRLTGVPALASVHDALRSDASAEAAVDGGGASGPTPLQVALRRRWSILCFALAVSAIIALVVGQLPVRYVAAAAVTIDERQPRVSNGESLLPSEAIDLELLRTYMAALRSPAIVSEVVRRLHLATNPELCAPPRPWWRALPGLGGPAAPASPCRIGEAAAARKLVPAVTFDNDDRSYAISINATAGDPALAAAIANSYADVFIERRREQQAGLSREANAWLSSHVAQLRAAVVAADAAVELARRRGSVTPLHGETLLSQTLTDMNTQLTTAVAELTQKQSTLDQLRAMAQAGDVDASAPILDSSAVRALVERESLLAATRDDLATHLGSENRVLIANEAELRRVRVQIRAEIDKAVGGLEGEVAALQARRDSLAQRVHELQQQVGRQAADDIRLQDLQRDAVSARALYDAAALRLEQIQVDAAIQRSDVQLLVEATKPSFPSFPRTRMILAGTFLSSIGAGAMLAYAMTLMSGVFSEPDEIEDYTGLRVLGLFPRIRSKRGRSVEGFAWPPDSLEAETVQAALAALIGPRLLRDRHPGLTIMVTSAVPGEGKTSFAVALGRAAASRGLSVVVMDCDLRRSPMRARFPALGSTAHHASDPLAAKETGFLGFMLEPSCGLRVVFAREPLSQSPHSLLGSQDFLSQVEQLRDRHQFVILDTPPVLAAPDALGLAHLVDEVVMVVGWRSTPRKAVFAALKALRRSEASFAGVVLSKVDLRRFARVVAGGYGYYARPVDSRRLRTPFKTLVL